MVYCKSEFDQNGAVVRLKFLNFMQYSDTEFNLGPNLNVIIGPNGSGKSTIVNGICIGLAGKLSVLGRATTLADYILVGQEEATIEIELFQKNGKNLVIRRNWNISGKNVWSMDGKKVSEKEVKDRVSKLRIQVDNLCQFLPQDKVHDFSRLNNKGLLDNTIDAVGDTGLKEKHRELKELQKELTEGEEIHNRKVQILGEKLEQCDKMEEEVKAFEEKRKLLEKIESLSQKRVWSVFESARNSCYEINQTYKKAKETKDRNEESLKPLKLEVNDLKKKIEKMTNANVTDAETIKECTNKAKFQSQRIEGFERELENVQDQAVHIRRREKEKEESIEKYQRTIRELEAEISESGEDESLLPRIEQAKQLHKDAARKLELEKNSYNEKKFEISALEADQRRCRDELRLLESVDMRKLEILKTKCQDAYKAIEWLRSNKDSFKASVYEPFIVCGNVINPDHAIYIENSIALKDLTIFFFEDVDDLNRFLNQTRSVMKLERVGGALVPPRSADEFIARTPAEQLQGYGLISYLKEMVQAPDKVLAYMCQQYQLHNTAVFPPSSEKHSDQIYQQFGISKYFFGVKSLSVSRSAYSGKPSTRTTEIRSQKTLGASLDQERINRVNVELNRILQEKKIKEEEKTSLDQNCQQCSVELERRRKEQRELEQQKNLVAKNTAMIENQRRHLREAMSNEEEEREKIELEETKKKSISNMVKAVELLQRSIQESCRARTQKDLKALLVLPLKKSLDSKEEKIANLREEMGEAEAALVAAEEELSRSKEHVLSCLREAKKTTGLNKGAKDKPPQEIQDYWDQAGFPDSVDEIDQLSGRLEAQASCADNINQSVLEKYRDLKEQIQELETDVKRRGKEKQNQSKRLESVKEEWLSSLNGLVGNINSRFSKFFGIMGFAGGVQLHTGSHENDFDNYGIKILVKYRDTEPLQELTPHHQSGGERSVATAIYMLALQALTTVPFRCVDEINQGMDARNERLVFELLVETSCQETNSQYFLLTPKLLTGLAYNPRMNVLIVHNGHEMLHHSEWNIDSIYENLKSIECA